MYIFSMKRHFVALSFFSLLIFNACQDAGKPGTEQAQAAVADTSYGKVEIFDPSAIQLVDSNATVELIAKGFVWS